MQSNKLKEINTLLNTAQIRSQESIDHMMSLYQVVEAFTSQDSKGNIYQVFTDYTSKLTRSEFTFFWLTSDENSCEEMAVNGIINKDSEEQLLKTINDVF
jgi:NarL family two-component system sensor histidine kinase LiaS